MNDRKQIQVGAESGPPTAMHLLKFAAAKSTIATLLAAAFAAGYLGADMVLPDWTPMLRVVAQTLLAIGCAGIVCVGLAALSSAAQHRPAELFEGHDEILVFGLLRVLPFLTTFAAGVLAAVLLWTARPDTTIAGVISTCAVLWLLLFESTADRFLCARLQR